ncbi:MAG: RNA pyrophosphohydrolase [Alphaproteobacteria bacterium]
MSVDPLQLPYRRGVGLCLFNAQGLVLVAERRDRRGAWQMPQGGIQKDEDLRVAALRELKEEIGTDNAEIIAMLPEKLTYEFPDWLQYRGGVFRGKYRGQEQDWFALRFLGQDSDIDLSGAHEPENPEFIAWRWAPLHETPNLIVDFKRPVYEKIVIGFKPLADALQRGEKLPPLKV